MANQETNVNKRVVDQETNLNQRVTEFELITFYNHVASIKLDKENYYVWKK